MAENPYAAYQQPAAASDPYAAYQQPAATFTSNLTDAITGAPAAIANTVLHPLDSLKAWRDQSKALHDAATDAADRGDYEAAAVHGINFLANIVPGLGSAMDEAASAKTPEEFKAKLGTVVGAALLMKAPELIKGTAGAAVSGAKAAGGAVADAAGNAAGKLRDAASHPAAGAVVDAIGMMHPGMAHAFNLVKRGSKVIDALRDSFGAPKGTAADAARPIGPPAPIPANEMLTPQFEEVPDVPRTAGPEAPPTAGPPLTSRPVGAPQPFTPNEMRTPQFEEVPDIPRRTDIPADQPAAAAGANAIRDGIAQGFKYKNFASIKDANVAATVQRLADQEASRNPGAPAAPPAPPAPPADAYAKYQQPAQPTQPTQAAAIPRADTLNPDIARTLKEGAVRVNPDGSRQVLQRVPIDKITYDAGNQLYPDVVGSYQRNGYTVHPEMKSDGLTVQEGHHRIESDKNNGKTDVLAWTPEADRPAPGTPPPAAAPTTSRPKTILNDVDAYLAQKRAERAAQAPPPGEPGEASPPAATPPPPASPAAPAAAPPPYGKQYITPGQVAKYAAENGLAEDDAAAALEKQGVSVVDRSSTNRVLHAIGAELGYDHGTLSEIAHATYGTGLGKITHEQMMELTEKLGNEQGTREPLATKRAGSAADAAIAPEAEGSPHGGVVAQLAPSELSTDPERFQYKQEAIGKGGVTDKFRDTTEWNEDNSGILSVWKDPADGKTYVVNGHHRLEMANRLGAKTVTVRYLDAANAAEARMKGALINIAEDQGTSIDAAKVFRDSGMSAADLQKQGIKLDGRIAKEGQALANLEPNIFSQVVSGEMKPERGAMIGQVADHADQSQLAKLLRDREASGKPMTDGQVSELVRMQAPQVTETQHSLFGDDEISRSLIAEKAGVSDYIQSRLTQKRRTFNAVGNERAATRLAEAGNVIDADKNAAIAEATNQEHAVYQKLSTATGPVSDALDEAAKALHAGENPAIVKVRTYAKIEPILKREADKLTGRSGAPGERSKGSAQPGSAEAGRGKHDKGAEEAPSKISDLMR